MIANLTRNAIIASLGIVFVFSVSQLRAAQTKGEDDPSQESTGNEAGQNAKMSGESKVELKKHFPTKQFEKDKDVKWSHAPYNKGKCSLCHESDDLEKPGPMKASVNRICLSCHERERQMLKHRKFIHKPVDEDCGYCHNAHNSKHRALLYKPMKELCVTCHTDQKAEIESRVQHDPVIQQDTCKTCHDPHGGKYAKRLFAPESKLCVDECHGNKKQVKDDRGRPLANIKKLQGKKFKHEPFGNKKCADCHNSHGSKHFRLLVANYPDEFYAKYKEGTYNLCNVCHKKERITEKKTTTLTGFRDGDRNLHYVHVVKPEYGRTCRSCHEDHATSHNHLMRTSVPYGPEGWTLDLNYVETKKGGRCSKTCHENETYNNKGVRPKDIAQDYKRKQKARKK